MLKKGSTFIRKNISSIIVVLLLVFLIYRLLPDPATIEQSIEEIKGASIPLTILAMVFFYLTIPLNALQLDVVSKVRVRHWITFKVQMAYLFIGKILPGSISAFIVNSFYLLRIGHTPAQTVSVIAIKAVSSSVAFLILTLIAIILGFSTVSDLNIGYQIESKININLERLLLIFVISGISIFWVLLKLEKVRELLNKTIKNFWSQFSSYRIRPWDVVKAITYSLILTTFQILTLMMCAVAIGLDVNFTQIFIIFTLGNIMTMLVPTPGGIGAAEAGLYAGFTILGFPESQSLAVVTLYRIITFWIPMIPGFIFFINLRKDVLKGFSVSGELAKVKSSRKR